MLNALAAHLLADFFLQNEWMSDNKSKPAHPAGYVHAGIHLVTLLAFGVAPLPSVLIAWAHLVIDFRTPLLWWGRLFKQSAPSANPGYVAFAMLRDQAAHGLVIYAVLRAFGAG